MEQAADARTPTPVSRDHAPQGRDRTSRRSRCSAGVFGLVIGVVLGAFAVPASAAPVPRIGETQDVTVTAVSCPATAASAKEVTCAVTVSLADIDRCSCLVLVLKPSAHVQVLGGSATGHIEFDEGVPFEGPLCSPDVAGGSAQCLFPASAMGVWQFKVRLGFELPLGVPVGTSKLPATLTASVPASISGERTPADNTRTGNFTIVYPRALKALSKAGAKHPRIGDVFYCAAIPKHEGHEAWCVSNVSSSRTGGKWGCGWIRAERLSLGSRGLPSATRTRRLQIDVRMQVRAENVFGAATWETGIDTSYAAHHFWSPANPGLGGSPGLTWSWFYRGTGQRAWAGDTFSMQQSGAIYRAQVRFRFYDKRFHLWLKTGDSDWQTLRYRLSGCEFTGGT